MDPRDTNEVIRKAGHAWRFFFVMLAIGLARSMAGASVSYRTIVAPLLVSQVAANWVETRCVIVAGQPETEQNRSNSHTSSGTTRVRYKYRYGGIDYVCDSKDLHSPSAAASGAKPAGFSLGAETVCYVNHLNPPESVLQRIPPIELAAALPGMLLLISGVTCLNAAGFAMLHRRNVLAARARNK